MEVRVLFRAPLFNNQRITADKAASVDMPNNGMNEAGDKMATNRGEAPPKWRSKKAGPFLKVKAGSAVVPIYRTESNGRVRFTLSFYRDGRRMRKMFNALEDAKKEAMFVAHLHVPLAAWAGGGALMPLPAAAAPVLEWVLEWVLSSERSRSRARSRITSRSRSRSRSRLGWPAPYSICPWC